MKIRILEDVNQDRLEENKLIVAIMQKLFTRANAKLDRAEHALLDKYELRKDNGCIYCPKSRRALDQKSYYELLRNVSDERDYKRQKEAEQKVDFIGWLTKESRTSYNGRNYATEYRRRINYVRSKLKDGEAEAKSYEERGRHEQAQKIRDTMQGKDEDKWRYNHYYKYPNPSDYDLNPRDRQYNDMAHELSYPKRVYNNFKDEIASLNQQKEKAEQERILAEESAYEKIKELKAKFERDLEQIQSASTKFANKRDMKDKRVKEVERRLNNLKQKPYDAKNQEAMPYNWEGTDNYN